MPSSLLRTLGLSVFLLGSAGFAPGADDIRDTARSVAESARKSVVTVRVVIKLKMAMQGQSQDQEQKLESVGTVIDPSGLTVVSASAVDSSSTIASLLKRFGQQVDISSEVKETTLLLDDGTEVESDIVLKDADLDLAFVRPRDAKLTLDAVELKAPKTQARPLDQVFAIGRLGKVANRATTLTLGEIRAYVKGPQPFYVADDTISANAGSMAYAADGSPLGLFVTKRAVESDDAAGMLGMLSLVSRRSDPSALVIVRPTQAILDLVPQAKRAEAPAKASEDKASEDKDAELPKAPAGGAVNAPADAPTSTPSSAPKKDAGKQPAKATTPP